MKLTKPTITALLYSVITPLEVYAALTIFEHDYLIGIPLLVIVAVMAFFIVKGWIKGQTEEIKK